MIDLDAFLDGTDDQGREVYKLVRSVFSYALFVFVVLSCCNKIIDLTLRVF